eukprot:g39537.t1
MASRTTDSGPPGPPAHPERPFSCDPFMWRLLGVHWRLPLVLGFLEHLILLHFFVSSKKEGEHSPIYINGTDVERVNSIKFLRVIITDNLSWTSHVDATVKKAQQRLFFLRQLRKFGMSTRILTNFYRCTIESILFRCITAWYGNCCAQDHKKLQEVVCTAQIITEANLPSMDSIYMAHCHGKAANIIKDPSHP